MNRTRDALIYAVGMLVQQGLTFASGVIVARALGPAGSGTTTLLRTMFQTVLIIAPLGLDAGLLKYVAQNEARRRHVHAQTSRLRLIVALLAILIVALCAEGHVAHWISHIYQHAALATYLLITFAALPFAADMAILGAVYRARGYPAPSVVATLYLQPVIRTGVLIALLQRGFAIRGVLLANLVATASAALTLMVHYHRTANQWTSDEAPLLDTAARSELASILTTSSWMALSLFTYGALRLIDVVILGAHVSVREIGEYGILSLFAQLIQVFPLALSQTLGPEIARSYQENNIADMKQTVDRYIRHASLLAGGVFGWVAVFGGSLDVIFGSAFHFDPVVALMLALGYLASATLAPTGYVLSMTGRHKPELLILASGAVMLGTFAALLIPIAGQRGAAGAVVLTFIMVNVVRFIYLSRVVGFRPGFAVDLLPPAIGFGSALIGSLLSRQLLGDSLPALIVGSTIFLGLYLWMTMSYFMTQEEHDEVRKSIAAVRHAWNVA